jgi:hypothetical protein
MEFEIQLGGDPNQALLMKVISEFFSDTIIYLNNDIPIIKA